jgi:hypothetical protein
MKLFARLSAICLYFSWCQPAEAQQTYATQDTVYIHTVEQALTYLQKGACQPCLDAYQRAFAISQKSALSAMRAALCAYQCGQIELTKSYIQRAVNIAYGIAESTWEDRQEAPEFDVVRSSGMKEYVQEIFARKDAELGINRPLKQQLQAIFTTDQTPRFRLDSVGRVHGKGSPEYQQIWPQLRKVDSINLVKIEQIIHQYGYPGKRLVGNIQANTTWLIIQHSPLSIQEKYLPMLQKAADDGEMAKSNMILLTDRIRMYKGQKQLYGTQVSLNATGQNSFYPIEDEVNVNKRRAEAGLEPLEEYAKRFGFDYKPVSR